ILGRHLVLAVVLGHDLDQIARAPADLHAREEAGQFVELDLLPDLGAPVVMTLGTLNLNAKEQPGRFRRSIDVSIGTVVSSEKECRPIGALLAFSERSLRGDERPHDLAPVAILLELLAEPIFKGRNVSIAEGSFDRGYRVAPVTRPVAGILVAL